MMNLARCKILYKIQNQEPIPNELLQKFLQNEKNSFLELANLFLDAQIKIHSFSSIKSYIYSTINIFFINNHYNYSEQAWYSFYLILCAYRNPIIDTQIVIDTYNNLPELLTERQELKWIHYRVITEILSYYMALEQDYTPILNKLDAIPQSIKDLEY